MKSCEVVISHPSGMGLQHATCFSLSMDRTRLGARVNGFVGFVFVLNIALPWRRVAFGKVVYG